MPACSNKTAATAASTLLSLAAARHFLSLPASPLHLLWWFWQEGCVYVFFLELKSLPPGCLARFKEKAQAAAPAGLPRGSWLDGAVNCVWPDIMCSMWEVFSPAEVRPGSVMWWPRWCLITLNFLTNEHIIQQFARWNDYIITSLC